MTRSSAQALKRGHGRRHPAKGQPVARRHINAVDEYNVKVNIEVERTPEALNQRHRTRVLGRCPQKSCEATSLSPDLATLTLAGSKVAFATHAQRRGYRWFSLTCVTCRMTVYHDTDDSPQGTETAI